MTRPRPRDFVGYGETPPAFSWPGGARMALDVILNYEEGAERSALDGDREIDEQSDASNFSVGASDLRNILVESTFEYGSRVGVWRILRLFERFGITATVYASAQALQRNRQVADAMAARGHQMVGHGHRWEPYPPLGAEGQRADIRQARAAIEDTTGQRISGWFTRAPQTEETRAILAREGLLYDSDAFNDDLPYFEEVEGRPFLVVPYNLTTNDQRFWQGTFLTADDFATFCIDSFDVLYEESAQMPRMMSVGLHARIIGQPGRIRGLERFLEHVAQHDDVWIPGRNAIAEFWAREFGPPDLWNAPEPEARG